MSRVLSSGNLFDAVARTVPLRPDRAALVFNDECHSLDSLLATADRVAGGLVAAGLQPGQSVSILADNRPEHLILYLAMARAGGLYIPINPKLAPPEIAYILDHATPSTIFVSEQLRPLLETSQALAAHRPTVRTLDRAKGDSDWSRVAASAPLGTSRGGGTDSLAVGYTSATTGRPKGVEASHNAQYESARAFAQLWSLGPDDCVLNGVTLAIFYGLTTSAITMLLAGVPLVLMERFDAQRALALIEAHRCTVMPAVPTMLGMLTETARLSARRYDTSSLRLPISSGQRLPAQTAELFRDTFGVPIYEYFAASECRPIFAWDLSRGDRPQQGKVGPVGPGVEARILDDTGAAVPVGSEGNLFVRGPTLMTGYYRNPELTRSVLRDGWFETGDRASIDADGIHTIGSRNREMINRGAAKVAPPEVETVLLAHPAVREAAVVGVPDPAFGEQVKAVLVLKPGVAAGVADIRRHCRAHLADFKVPGIVVFVDALPIGPTGKVLKRALVDL